MEKRTGEQGVRAFLSVAGRAVTALTILIIPLAAAFVIPKAAGLTPYIVKSGSMEPAIGTGAVIFVNTGDKNVRTGDIVTYRLGGTEGRETLVTHRIVGMENGMYITKGDANDGRDQYLVAEEQLVGTYLYQIPKIGYLAAKLDQKVLTAAAVWIFLANGMLLLLGSAFGTEATKEEQAGKHSQNRTGSRPQKALNKKEKGVQDRY